MEAGKPSSAKENYKAHLPYNFSWLVRNKMAGMGWPETVENLNYLVKVGVNHLVTLSPEMVPPIMKLPLDRRLKWTEIPVEEFEAPSLSQIVQFIGICQRAEQTGEVVGVHCRQGCGRTGVMLASYLVHARGMQPEEAIRTVRLHRPGSCETYEQERVVSHYYDALHSDLDLTEFDNL